MRLETIRAALQPDFGLGWNLLLALAPLLLAGVLFRPLRPRGLLWWPLFIAFVLFLPNAAYTLTDVIHLVHRIRRTPLMPVWTVSLVLIPQYAAFMLVGLQSHVLSLMLFARYLRMRGARAWVVPMEIALNFLCSLGIFFGRYQRLNSWDIVSEPERIARQAIDDLTTERPVELVFVTFVVLSTLYYATKLINGLIVEGIQSRRSAHRGGVPVPIGR